MTEETKACESCRGKGNLRSRSNAYGKQKIYRTTHMICACMSEVFEQYVLVRLVATAGIGM
jgi:hypothetical protein